MSRYALPPCFRPRTDMDPAEAEEAQRLLARSMIRQAAIDCAHGHPRLDPLAVSTYLWILADDDEMPGFVWCCHTLGLRHTIARAALIANPARVATLLSRLTEAHHKSGVA